MKKTIGVLIFGLYSSLLLSQNDYQPLISTEKQWIVCNHSVEDDETSNSENNCSIVKFGDEITLNNKVYRKLLRKKFYETSNTNGPEDYSNLSQSELEILISKPATYIEDLLAFREDIEEKKIYVIFHTFQNPKEILYYDFNLGVGDKLEGVMPIIQSIEIINTNGRNRQKVIYDSMNTYFKSEADYSIEGIGGRNGISIPLSETVCLLSSDPSSLCINSYGDIKCVQENGVEIYGDCTFSNTILSTDVSKPVNNRSFQVFPNPGNTFFYLKNTYQKTNNLTVTLTNIQGQKISLNSSIENDKLIFDTKNIGIGIYILKITGSNNIVNFIKWIKK